MVREPDEPGAADERTTPMGSGGEPLRPPGGPPGAERLGSLDALPAASTDEEYLAHFRLVEKAGAGGMGAVYRALDTLLDREVAVKVLAEALQESAELQDRFIREARIIARLSHPNLPHIYFIGRAGARLFFAMEWIAGETLQSVLQRGPLAVDRALDVVGQVAAGLEVAHRAGVIHRDIKPSNIMLATDGTVKVLDFGIARSQSSDVSATLTGGFMGTPLYTSPEQAKGERADHRSDIYALGATLYECLSGRSPFTGENPLAVLSARLTQPPPELPESVPCPPEVRRLVRSLMARDPAERPADWAEVRREIRRALPEPPVPARVARRWIAALADLLLLTIPPAVFFLAFLRVEGYFLTTLLYDSFAGRMILGLGMLAWFAAYYLFLGGRSRRSWGQRVEELRILTVKGKEPTARRLLLRTLVLWGPACLALAIQPDWPPDIESDSLWRNDLAYEIPLLWYVGMALVLPLLRGRRHLADWASGTRVMEPGGAPEAPAAPVRGGRRFASWISREALSLRTVLRTLVLVAWAGFGFLTWRQSGQGYPDPARDFLVEVVKRGDPGWNRLLLRFPSFFLSRESRMVNPEVLGFRREFLWPGIHATPEGKLVVVNDRYGSRITESGFGWSPFGRALNDYFTEELQPATAAEAAAWEANRREAYRGSYARFLRALMHRRLAAEGYEVLNPEAFQCLMRIDETRFLLVAWPRLDVRISGYPGHRSILLHRGVLVVNSSGTGAGSWGLTNWSFLEAIPGTVLLRYAEEQDRKWGVPTRDIRDVWELK